MLLWIEFASEAANRIYRSIVDATAGEKVLKPILYPYDTEGSTRFVDFDTSRAYMPRAKTVATSPTSLPTRTPGTEDGADPGEHGPSWPATSRTTMSDSRFPTR